MKRMDWVEVFGKNVVVGEICGVGNMHSIAFIAPFTGDWLLDYLVEVWH